MSVATQATEHMGESAGMRNHDHDMVHDLSERLDALWRYDQYIANAEGMDDVQAFWKKVKQQEQENVRELKNLIAEHVRKDCF
jgi:uncharacterized protein (DUF427 family)